MNELSTAQILTLDNAAPAAEPAGAPATIPPDWAPENAVAVVGSMVLTAANDTPASATSPKVVEEKPKEVGPSPRPTQILVVDIGGTKTKALASAQKAPRKTAPGKRFTPAKLVQ